MKHLILFVLVLILDYVVGTKVFHYKPLCNKITDYFRMKFIQHKKNYIQKYDWYSFDDNTWYHNSLVNKNPYDLDAAYHLTKFYKYELRN